MSGDIAVKEASPGYELKAANQVIPVGYRKTDIGLIPNDWKHAPLSDLVEKGTRITYGVVQPGKNDPNGVLFIRGGDVYGGRILEDGLRRISETISKDYKRTCLSGGELLISLVGYPGEVALVPSRLAGSNIARQVALVKLESSNELSAEYVCSYLRSNFGRNQLLKEAIGSAQQVINLKDVNKVEVVLPASLDEQRAIATALSDVDALLEELDRLIAKKRDLKQAAMQQLLTGQTRLPGFEGEWERKPLGELVDCASSGTYGVERASSTLLPMPVATTAQISNDDRWNDKSMQTRFFTAEQVASYGVSVGDLIVVKSSGSAASIQSGKMVLVDELLAGTFLFSNFLMRLRPKEIIPKFLYFFLTSNRIKRMLPSLCEASTYPNIRINEYLEIDIPIPDIKEQTAIATVISEIDAELEALRQRRAKTTAVKQAMVQELLTGRIRLV